MGTRRSNARPLLVVTLALVCLAALALSASAQSPADLPAASEAAAPSGQKQSIKDVAASLPDNESADADSTVGTEVSGDSEVSEDADTSGSGKAEESESETESDESEESDSASEEAAEACVESFVGTASTWGEAATTLLASCVKNGHSKEQCTTGFSKGLASYGLTKEDAVDPSVVVCTKLRELTWLKPSAAVDTHVAAALIERAGLNTGVESTAFSGSLSTKGGSRRRRARRRRTRRRRRRTRRRRHDWMRRRRARRRRTRRRRNAWIRRRRRRTRRRRSGWRRRRGGWARRRRTRRRRNAWQRRRRTRRRRHAIRRRRRRTRRRRSGFGYRRRRNAGCRRRRTRRRRTAWARRRRTRRRRTTWARRRRTRRRRTTWARRRRTRRRRNAWIRRRRTRRRRGGWARRRRGSYARRRRTRRRRNAWQRRRRTRRRRSGWRRRRTSGRRRYTRRRRRTRRRRNAWQRRRRTRRRRTAWRRRRRTRRRRTSWRRRRRTRRRRNTWARRRRTRRRRGGFARRRRTRRRRHTSWRRRRRTRRRRSTWVHRRRRTRRRRNSSWARRRRRTRRRRGGWARRRRTRRRRNAWQRRRRTRRRRGGWARRRRTRRRRGGSWARRRRTRRRRSGGSGSTWRRRRSSWRRRRTAYRRRRTTYRRRRYTTRRRRGTSWRRRRYSTRRRRGSWRRRRYTTRRRRYSTRRRRYTTRRRRGGWRRRRTACRTKTRRRRGGWARRRRTRRRRHSSRKPVPSGGRRRRASKFLKLGVSEAWRADFFSFNQGRSLPNLNNRAPQWTAGVAKINFPAITGVWPGVASRFRDNFAVRFTGVFYARYTATYKFWLASDDGSRLVVDSRVVIDNNGLHAMVTKSASRRFKAGYHAVTVDFFEKGGGAGVQLWWSGPGFGKRFMNVPRRPVRRHFWKAQFWFVKTGRSMPAVPNRRADFQRYAPWVNMPAGYRVPGLPTHYRTDHFRVRFSGLVHTKRNGWYNFWVASDDGSLMYVDGALVVNNDGLHGTRWRHGRKYLQSGFHTTQVDCFEHGGHSSCIAHWSGPGFGRRLIPSSIKRRATTISGRPSTYWWLVDFYKMTSAKLAPTPVRRPSYSKTTLRTINFKSTSARWPGIPAHFRNHFFVNAQAMFVVGRTASYTFWIGSDDGSKLWIDDKLVINNDGLHAMKTKAGSVFLRRGAHIVKTCMFERGGAAGFKVEWARKGLGRTLLKAARSVRSGYWWISSFLRSGQRSLQNVARVTPHRTSRARVINVSTRPHPWPGLGYRDNFQLVYTGAFVAPVGGLYHFYVASDDGGKLWVDGRLVVNNDGLHGMRWRTGGINLARGLHSSRVEFFERGGWAGLRVHWAGPTIRRQLLRSILPARQPRKLKPIKGWCGWKGQFWNIARRTSLPPMPQPRRADHRGCYDSLNFPASGAAWKGVPRTFKDAWAVRFRGYKKTWTNGMYHFWVRSDDGARMYVNGRLVVNNDGLHGSRWRHGRMPLRAGRAAFVVDMFERAGAAGLRVEWSGPGFGRRMLTISKPLKPRSLPSRCGWRNEYFKLSKKPTRVPVLGKKRPEFVRCSRTVNISPRRGAFPGVPKLGKFYAARYSGIFKAPKAGVYTFWTSSDDGSKLSIDSALVVNNDGLHAMRSKFGRKRLTAGWHSVVAVLIEAGGAAGIRIHWAGPGMRKRLLKLGNLQTKGGSFKAQFWRFRQGRAIPNLDKRGEGVVRATTYINYASTSRPWYGVYGNHFAARFTGAVFTNRVGLYTFFLASDDGGKLWVDGKLVVNNDGLHAMRWRQGEVQLSSGFHVIRVDFFEHGGKAGLQLQWAGPGTRGRKFVRSVLPRGGINRMSARQMPGITALRKGACFELKSSRYGTNWSPRGGRGTRLGGGRLLRVRIVRALGQSQYCPTQCRTGRFGRKPCKHYYRGGKCGTSNWFKTQQGTTCVGCRAVSLESCEKPNYYMRHAWMIMRLHRNDGSTLFARDSTFFVHRRGKDVMLESANIRRSFVWPRGGANGVLRIQAGRGARFTSEASWRLTRIYKNWKPTTLTAAMYKQLSKAGVFKEYYEGIKGYRVRDMTDSRRYRMGKPSSKDVDQCGAFETASHRSNFYGGKVYGLFRAPVTGNYRFYVASNDNGELWISRGTNRFERSFRKFRLRKIAYVPGWTHPRQWNRYKQQRSKPIYMREGYEYYLEGLFKEHGGGDNFAVGVVLPNGKRYFPIPVPGFFGPKKPVRLRMDYWKGISGHTVRAMTKSRAFNPKRPSGSSQVCGRAKLNLNLGLYTGVRLSWWFNPPKTGKYSFYIASDDDVVLRMSKSERASAGTVLAKLTNPKTAKWMSKWSRPVTMTVGQLYYMTVMAKPSKGGRDTLRLGLRRPDGRVEIPMKIDSYMRSKAEMMKWKISKPVPKVCPAPDMLSVCVWYKRYNVQWAKSGSLWSELKSTGPTKWHSPDNRLVRSCDMTYNTVCVLKNPLCKYSRKQCDEYVRLAPRTVSSKAR